MKKILVCTNPARDGDLRFTGRVTELLKEEGFVPTLTFPFSADVDTAATGLDYVEIAEGIRDTDCMLCLGGDGTILHVAWYAASHNVPVITVNLGHLGFICELDENELEVLRTLKDGNYTVERRMMLDVAVYREGKSVYHRVALNEATLHRGAVSRVIGMRLFFNGRKIYDLRGDGLLVATPTGSTGYTMSAGGPIMEPNSQAMIVTPICAHNMRTGSFVLLPDDVVTVEAIEHRRCNGFLCVDGGRPFALHENDRVEIKRSRFALPLLRLTQRKFYDDCGRKMITGGYQYEN